MLELQPQNGQVAPGRSSAGSRPRRPRSPRSLPPAVRRASNAKEVSTAIQTVAQVTEKSAAGSEEMASSSEELGAQATALRELVSGFRTGSENQVAVTV